MSKEPTLDHASKWHDVIWREWRHCQNKLYAEQLFGLVADARVGWGSRVTFMLLEGIIGMVLGLLIGFVATTEWRILQQLLLAGGAIGAGRGLLVSQRLSWRAWLTRLALGLPVEQPNRGLLVIGLLLLLASLIFGPVLWLLLIGLFWGMSGVIQWMTKGLAAANAYSYNSWYFWWRSRPSLDEVEAALAWAALTGLPEKTPLSAPPNALSEPPSDPIEVDFEALRAYARHRNLSQTP